MKWAKTKNKYLCQEILGKIKVLELSSKVQKILWLDEVYTWMARHRSLLSVSPVMWTFLAVAHSYLVTATETPHRAITTHGTYFCPGPEELTGLCPLVSLGLPPEDDSITDHQLQVCPTQSPYCHCTDTSQHQDHPANDTRLELRWILV